MPGKSVYLSRAVLGHVFRTSTYSKPTNVYISLHGADPTDANLTSTELAIGTGGYARATVSVADAQWTAPATSGTDEVITNANTISYGTATENWNGGDAVTHFGIYDASTAGNLLYSGALGTARTVLSGDPVSIAAGALSIRES
jgi:hypothetical protein